MDYSSYPFILLLLSCIRAAPQGSPACGQITANSAAGEIGAQYLQIPGCDASSDRGSSHRVGNGTETNNITGSTSASAPVSTTPLTSQGFSTNATTSGGKCPAGFRNAVFNTGASKNAGWPQTTWNSLTSNGVNDWSKSASFTGWLPSELELIMIPYLVGFALSTLDITHTYNTDSGPAKTSPSLNAGQIHQVMDPTDVSAAVQLLQNNPPQYLTIFNEPDYSYQGLTPLTSATDAAKDLQPLFAASHPKTTYLSPALANASSDWLPTFRDACNGCMSQIPIIAMHLYNQGTNAALALIK